VPSSRGRRFRVVGLAVLLALGFAACGDDDDDDTAPETTDTEEGGGGGGGGESVAFEVSDLSYQDVTAPAGGTIEITNTSGAPHTFTADDGAFDVDYEADGTATVNVPAEPGDYAFHCEIHGSMQATLTAQ